MLFLILPPPFIQITLVYLESVWPYIIGLSLIIFIIFDLISNPYTNTMSLYQNNNQISSATKNSQLTKQTSFANINLTQFLPIKLESTTAKIFGFSFLTTMIPTAHIEQKRGARVGGWHGIGWEMDKEVREGDIIINHHHHQSYPNKH